MRRSRQRWLGVLVATGLVMAACGDDDDDAADDDDTSTGEFEPLSFDESDKCGTEEYSGNIASIEAVDELTVKFTLCEPDAALPSKVAFSAVGIHPTEHLEETGGSPVDNPIGTGPYQLTNWSRGTEIVLDRFEDYWGDPAPTQQVIFRWSEESAQRLVQLQSGDAHGIDNVGTEDFSVVEGDDSLQLVDRTPINIFYVGFNVDREPFDSHELREAISLAIDRQRIVDNFYPEGSQVADQFVPPGIPLTEEDAEPYEYDPDRARALLEQAGFGDGVDLGNLSYRVVDRTYLPQPAQVASDIRDQLAQVGITVQLDEQESGAFIDNANAGNLGFYLLGWNADWPDPTNFWDFHFGVGASPQFGTGFPDLHEVLTNAATTNDEDERADLYAQANELLRTHNQGLPIAYGASAVAYTDAVQDPHASPLSNERFAAMSVEGSDQFVFVQNGEPSGLYCADETDGEALRVCEQINESLLAYEVGGTEVEPALAEELPEPNEDSTEWTFRLRDGVKFHDGTDFDANDVVMSYRVQWDGADPLHTGRDGLFTYWGALFGGMVNPPPEAEG